MLKAYHSLLLIVLVTSIEMTDSRGPTTITVGSIEEDILNKIEFGNPLIADTAMVIASEYPGEYNINQVCEIYDTLTSGGWYYYSDPTSTERFNYANKTLQLGKIASTIGSGDCDDFAILMASLIESIGGTTRVNLALAPDGSGHAYTEVYIGKERRVDNLLGWLKDEYNKSEITGLYVDEGDVWLNLDWSSDDPYPGRPYFEGQRFVTFIRDAENKASPKIIPIIDAMDSSEGWVTHQDKKGSSISIKSTVGKKGKGLEISYDLVENGWVGISKDLDPNMLSGTTGLEFSNYAIFGEPNTIKLKMIYKDGTAFGVLWNNATLTDGWSTRKALYANFGCIRPADKCEANMNKLDPKKVCKIEFNISNNPNCGDELGSGTIIIDQIQGKMAMPTGSPWELAEKEHQNAVALRLAAESDNVRGTSGESLVRSVLLAVESLRHNHTLAGDQALRRGLESLPIKIVMMTHDGSVNSVVYSPDGKYLATVSDDKIVRLWEADSGQDVFRIDHEGHVNVVVFSQDGKYLATASDDNTGGVWEVVTGQEVSRMTHEGCVYAAAFSQNGSYLATASKDNTTRVWKVSTGQEVSRINHESDVNVIAFSQDGKYVAAGNEYYIKVWKLETCKAVFAIDQYYYKGMVESYLIEDIAFSSDGNHLATANRDGTAKLWNVVTGDLIKTMSHEGRVITVLFNSNGTQLATICDDNTTSVWAIDTGREVLRMNHEDRVNTIVFSQDGRYLATASDDNTARAWDVKARQEVARMVHESSVNAIAFSPDGRYLATASDDNTVVVWKVEAGQEVARMPHEDSVNAISFSPDGRYLATASADSTAKIWDADTGQEIAKINHSSLIYEDNFVQTIVFSPNGKFLATAVGDETARIWDLSSFNSCEAVRVTHGSWIVHSVAFDPDGKLLATASNDNTARLWDINTGQEVARITHEGDVNYVAFSTDGKFLATASDDNTAKLWDINSDREVARMAHEGDVNAVIFSPIGTLLATASDDNTARIWDVDTDHEIFKATHEGRVRALAFSPNGTYLATASDDKTAKIWDIENGKEIARVIHDDSVRIVSFSPDGKFLATASDDKTARIWNVYSCTEVARMAHGSSVYDVEFICDGKYLATANGGSAKVWETNTGKEIKTIYYYNNLSEDALNDIAFSPDGKYFAAKSVVSAKIWDVSALWDVSTREEFEVAEITHKSGLVSRFEYLNPMERPNLPFDQTQQYEPSDLVDPTLVLPTYSLHYIEHPEVYNIAFSYDSKYLITASGGSARVWRAATQKEVLRLDHNDRVKAAIFSPDGKYLATASDDGTSRIWHAITGEESLRLGHSNTSLQKFSDVAFSPDGTKMATASDDNTARLWDVDTGREVAKMTHEDDVNAVTFSLDRAYLATASDDKTAKIWDTTTGELIVTIPHEFRVLDVAFSPKGTFLATANSDNTAIVWNFSTRQEIARLTHKELVNAVAFSPNGKFLATACDDGFARLWLWRPEDIITEACSRLNRNLRPDEWNRYLGDEHYRNTCYLS